MDRAKGEDTEPQQQQQQHHQQGLARGWCAEALSAGNHDELDDDDYDMTLAHSERDVINSLLSE